MRACAPAPFLQHGCTACLFRTGLPRGKCILSDVVWMFAVHSALPISRAVAMGVHVNESASRGAASALAILVNTQSKLPAATAQT